MKSTLLASDFPPLSSVAAVAPAPLRNWNQIFAPDISSSSSKAFSFSHHPSEPEIIPFSGEKLALGGEDRSLCLVGYSIGRRPYYEALLGAFNRTWVLKGSLKLLSLSDGFFLLKASYLDVIKVSLDGDVIDLRVLYEWRPIPCEHCKSLVHYSSSCPQNPNPVINDPTTSKQIGRGRSFSKKPSNRLHSRSRPPRSEAINSGVSKTVALSTANTISVHTNNNTVIPPIGDSVLVGISSDAINATIPNLNIPTEELSSSSTSNLPSTLKASTRINSPNKFQILSNQSDTDLLEIEASNADIVNNAYKQPGKGKKQATFEVTKKTAKGKQDMLCLLETRVHASSLLDPFFDSSHRLFSNEDSFHNFNLASSGRIWIKWDASKLSFSPSLVTSQLINGTVSVGNSPPFQFSIVYAANNALDRKELWSSLCAAAPSGNTPWAVIGDFNCCCYASDKSGGLPLHHSNLVDINNMIFVNKLVDLNAVGSLYSWYNQQTANPIFIKLDRALVNEDWIKNFPNSFSSFQTSCSDHSPIILHPGLTFHAHHKFLFKNFWTNNDRYWVYLLNAFSLPMIGNPLSHLCFVFRQLKGEIKNHNWANSQSLSAQLEVLHADQLNFLQQIQINPLDLSLVASLKETNLKIAEVSSSLASWVIQRAKINWLHHGEDDLKFLYGKIRCRQGSSKLVANLFSCNSDLSREEVLNSIIRYFHNLFNPPSPPCQDVNLIPVGAVLPDFSGNLLTMPILEAEIREAIFKGSSKSSPRPDGFNYHFYKSGWHIIGPTVCKAINAFFSKSYLPSGIKATALAIIPKHCNASSITDYRPISLCNTLFKIIAKVIAGRLKSMMPSIVKDSQAGFVKSRNSTDNILLANDILSLINKKGVDNIFCAKIDIKKGFDSVSREFLLARLLHKGFPKTFISWIKACITNVNFSMVIDGSLEGYFPSSAGLRQGCPLSPYLFCIVMDAFSNLLEARGFKGFNADNFHLSHLLYADDVLIFGEATIENCSLLSSILDEFAQVSGLHVNYDKCSVMFSKNQRNQNSLCQALSISQITSKISYLGIPISFNRLRVADYLPLMDSIHNKFDGWKANLLSFAGRLQYLKFTIQNTIAYWIRGSILPKTVFKFFKKTYSRFLFFGDITCSNKLHMVSWDNVCKPKDKGGLGIPSLSAIQFAFNCTIIYMMYNSHSPLSNWLSTRYSSPWKPPSPQASKFWISICNTAALVKANFKFIITPTAPIALHWDHLCDNNTLLDKFGRESLDCFSLPLVKHYIVSGGWNLAVNIPNSICDYISRILIINSSGPCLIWKDMAKVKFSEFLEEFYCSLASCSWHSLVWHQKHVLKHSVFVWLALVVGLKTQDALRLRNIHVPLTCSLCQVEPETVNHLFFECPFAFSVLSSLIPASSEFLLRPTVLQFLQWLDSDFVGTTLLKNYFKMVWLLVAWVDYFSQDNVEAPTVEI
ncbi:uncharacterized protein LOC110108146 [Dendrobium catenatum]|uniref:uncharacterized protein LOC110108146 n=1 Tax=Dendrobium catenatum TaxID=906689 RepID=UPI0009F56AC3|nr:uncharacterized protein LOC110108146 [Dendrobium catenatum]